MLYKNAGVDIHALNLVKRKFGKEVMRTFTRGIKSKFGLFGGIYPMNAEYLISSVDGVGTKILVACAMGIHHTIGIDLVNHCVNDILTTGALPLFFLDYIAFSQIERNHLVDIVNGIAEACKMEHCLLVGGETAQMPKFYPKGVYDLVGFIVGKVNKKDYINIEKISSRDILLGLKSSGLHTNGYSLARKVLLRKFALTSYMPEFKCSLGEELLKTHCSYRRCLVPRLKYVKGLVHITGGGFYDNIKRILPRNQSAIIYKNSWRPLPIFKLIQEVGKIPDEEMYRVFNMGIGMVVIVKSNNLKYFKPLKPKIIGEIVKGNFGVKLV